MIRDYDKDRKGEYTSLWRNVHLKKDELRDEYDG